ncbi:MAG: TIGR03663 family protein [Anaerolineae bacterium]|nr:TIGR03663 family protein [Anaerolineae bacterium]
MNSSRDNWLDRPIVEGVGLTREQGLYVLIVTLCLVSRLAMLGFRVQSHDESLHTKYSWNLYAGLGFQHAPVYHGPFLFHATALSYALFGDNDFTARLPVALMGTLLVAFPYLLRRYMGRKGALAASALLLISPSITYYSRYIRHDIPVMLWAAICIWAIFRYLDEGQERHLYVLAGAFSLMYATKEVAAIYTLFFAVFLVGLFLVRALRATWERPQAESWFLGALVVVTLGVLALMVGSLVSRPDPQAAEVAASLPVWAAAGGWVALLAGVGAVVALLRGLGAAARTFRSFDLLALIGTLSLPFASPLLAAAASRAASAIVGTGTSPTFLYNLATLELLNEQPPHVYITGAALGLALAAAVAIGLWWDVRRWPIAAAVYGVIYLVLFTTVFTNGAGIATGWVASVGYWMEQQAVERGSQPWFYYLFILPLYDFLPLIGALAATVVLAVRGIGRLVRQRDAALDAPDGQQPAPNVEARALFVPFLLLWSVLAWVGYSYAGERMPWLTVHIALPMILLTGWLVGQLLGALDWRRAWETRGWLLVPALPPLTAALVATAQALGNGPFEGVALDTLRSTGAFIGALVGLLGLGVLTVWLWRRTGARTGGLLAALTALLALALLTVRIAYRFSFVNFDYPTEFLVYAHESGDVRTTMAQLEELSLRTGVGAQHIDVTYGPDGSWPFYWYLRDYPNARFYPAEPTRDQVLATAIIAGQGEWDVVEPYVGDDYVRFDYTFLWWPSEDYRELTWGTVWEWLADPQKRAALWQIFYHREYDVYDAITGKHHELDRWPLHQEYRLYVRRDVVNQLWDFGIGPTAGGAPESADPYAGGWVELAPWQTWGSEGSGPGQFSAPRGIAVAPDGTVYVADSRNHRIQLFDATGALVDTWGSYGECNTNPTPPPGTFCEPWDVAVAPDGSVYVADTWAHRVQHFTAAGEVVAAWGSFGQFGVGDPLGEGHFFGPRAVAVGPDGRVYVVDTGNKRVQVFTPEGEFVTQWGGYGSAAGQMDEPVGAAFTPDGQIVVADSWNVRVQALTPDGEPLASWPIDGWNNPMADEKPYVAVDAAGRIYVTDPGGYRVLVFDGEGTYLFSFGQFGFEQGAFTLPMGIAVGPNGAVYVTDADSDRVQVFDPPPVP